MRNAAIHAHVQLPMVSPAISRRTLLAVAAAGPWSRLQASGSAFWNAKDPAQWTPDEIKKLTTNSPWAKPVQAKLRLPGRYPKYDVYFHGTARWESAQPIRDALKDPLPATFANHYVISVSGLTAPNQEDLEEVKQGTTLEKKPGGIKYADLVKRGEGSHPTVLFGFPRSTLVPAEAEFSELEVFLRLDPLFARVRFTVKQMSYCGALAL
jgi:hypothetical protein